MFTAHIHTVYMCFHRLKAQQKEIEDSRRELEAEKKRCMQCMEQCMLWRQFTTYIGSNRIYSNPGLFRLLGYFGQKTKHITYGH